MHIHEVSKAARGRAKIDIYDGEVRWEKRGDLLVPVGRILKAGAWRENLETTGGKNLQNNRFFNIGGASEVAFMGVGTDSTAPAVGQTQLNPSVVGSVQVKAFDAPPTPPSGVSPITCVTTFGLADANFNWQEAGMFNGPTNGINVMVDRILTQPIIGAFTKTGAVSAILQFQWTQN